MHPRPLRLGSLHDSYMSVNAELCEHVRGSGDAELANKGGG